MPRKLIYRTSADKQAAYRERCNRQALKEQCALEGLFWAVTKAAGNGSPIAQACLRETPADTLRAVTRWFNDTEREKRNVTNHADDTPAPGGRQEGE